MAMWVLRWNMDAPTDEAPLKMAWNREQLLKRYCGSAHDFVKEVYDCLDDQATLAQDFPAPRDTSKLDEDILVTGMGRGKSSPWELDMPYPEQDAENAAELEVNSWRWQVKRLDDYKTKRSELLGECEEDVARRRDVMDMHAVEWEKFRKDSDLAELQHPAATDFYCPEVTQLAKETIERNASGEYKTVRYYSKQLHKYTGRTGKIHSQLGPYEIPKAFQAKDSSPLLRERNASKSQVGQPSPDAAPAALGQAWTPLPRATARWGRWAELWTNWWKMLARAGVRPRSITKLFTVSGKKKTHTRRRSDWRSISTKLTLPQP